jgi:hypothetical protein
MKSNCEYIELAVVGSRKNPLWASDLDINAEKTKYMIMSRYPNSGQNQNIGIANESFENVATFKYLETTLTNQNDICDEIQNRLNSGNSCYFSPKSFVFPSHIKKPKD